MFMTERQCTGCSAILQLKVQAYGESEGPVDSDEVRTRRAVNTAAPPTFFLLIKPGHPPRELCYRTVTVGLLTSSDLVYFLTDVPEIRFDGDSQSCLVDKVNHHRG